MTTGINLLDIAIPIILLLYFLAGVRSGFFTTLGTFLGIARASAPQPGSCLSPWHPWDHSGASLPPSACSSSA